MMKNQEPEDVTCVKVVWTINKFSRLKTNHKYHSEVFTIAGCAWKISFYRGREYGKDLSIFLEVADGSSLPQGWSIYAEYTLTLVNQASTEKSVKGDLYNNFSADEIDWGFVSFMDLDTLENPSEGYILNDKCIVEVEFSEVSSEGIQVVGQIENASLIPKDDEGVVEFKDLGLIEKALVPILEEACWWHPSLLDCKQKRSPKFMEWAFTALGLVLQFLKNTNEWESMNEKAFEELQQLWEELEMSRLDLSWLKPHVKSALKMKGYAEKVEKANKLKQNLVALEMETKMMKENMGGIGQRVGLMRKTMVNGIE